MKIGASRFPEKRLQQARKFNPDLNLLASVRVKEKKVALSQLQEKLAGMLHRGTPFWYRGPIDKILETFEEMK